MGIVQLSAKSSKEAYLQKIEKALKLFPELQKIFNQRWLKQHIGNLSKQQTAQLQEWEQCKHIDVNEQSPHLLLFWALLPLDPNPFLKALNDTIVFLRYANVRGLDKKVMALKSKKDFWQTLSEIYFAAHLLRAGASVTEFDPPSAGEFKGDLAFSINCWEGVVEIHTVIPPKTEPTERQIEAIIDPLQITLKKWSKKRRQLAPYVQKLRIFAESVNLMGVGAQLPFVDRDLFALPKEVCQQAFDKGLDAVALFAIDQTSGLLWAIRWYWRPDLSESIRQFLAFRDYPKVATMHERADWREIPEINIGVPTKHFFLATVLDYFEDGLLTPDEAVEALKDFFLGKLHLTLEQFLRIAHKYGIPYFRMTEEEWGEEGEVAKQWVKGDDEISR